MNIKNLFASLRGNDTRENVLHTPYGTINLAREDGRRQMKHIITQIQRNTDALTRKDIADWRRAWQAAINIDNPNRGPLYDIYRDTDADAHLSGCIRQREGFVMAKSFKIVDGKGEDNPKLLDYFDHAWFKDLCLLVLDANYWGHSLVELGDIVGAGTPGMTYTGVTLLPRKHVIPEYGRVITEPGQDWRAGIDYRSPGITESLIEAGKPDDLGLLLKATLHTIPKKNMLAFWDTFGEIFGMPMRIAKTASRDKKEVDKLNQMLVNAGASQTAVVPLDTELEFIESTRADAYHVYNERIPDLVAPLLAGEADVVIADRQTSTIEHFSWFKKRMQGFGSRIVNAAAGTRLPDAASGFRAYSKRALLRLNVVTQFSYCMETIIQAGNKRLRVASVPVETNPKTRESRLFSNVFQHMAKSGMAIVRSFLMFKPHVPLGWLAAVTGVLGLIPFVRFLVFELRGDGGGHVQSLVFGSAMIVASLLAVALLVIADLQRTNRVLVEETLERVKALQYAAPRAPADAAGSGAREPEAPAGGRMPSADRTGPQTLTGPQAPAEGEGEP